MGNDINILVVKNMQRKLRRLYYYRDETDGLWGERSSAALIAFQADNNIRMDGVWGPVSSGYIDGQIQAVDREESMLCPAGVYHRDWTEDS